SRSVLRVPQGTGSGFVWDEHGRIVTNYHVIQGAQEAVVTLADQRMFPATLVGANADHDLAVLQIEMPGHVVVVDFWTYSCINCLRALPYVKAWYEKYRSQGLVVIGIHAPEFAFEKDLRNVRREVKELGIEYPVAVDNDFA